MRRKPSAKAGGHTQIAVRFHFLDVKNLALIEDREVDGFLCLLLNAHQKWTRVLANIEGRDRF